MNVLAVSVETRTEEEEQLLPRMKSKLNASSSWDNGGMGVVIVPSLISNCSSWIRFTTSMVVKHQDDAGSACINSKGCTKSYRLDCS